jgi:hypothetical protein
LVAGHAVDLAHQIPQRDLDARDTATLPACAAELLDRPKDHVDIAGILAQQHIFELERILFVAGVAHLADAVDALVSVDADDRVIVVAGDHRDAHVGDLQVARSREGGHSLLDLPALGRIFGDVRHYLLLCCFFTALL